MPVDGRTVFGRYRPNYRPFSLDGSVDGNGRYRPRRKKLPSNKLPSKLPSNFCKVEVDVAHLEMLVIARIYAYIEPLIYQNDDQDLLYLDSPGDKGAILIG